MLRAVRLSVFFLMILTIWAQPARADIWDWLEELTAPGPSHSRGNLTLTLHCQNDKDKDLPGEGGWFKPLGRNSDKRICYFADVRRFKSEEDARFFPARIEMYESGPTFRLVPQIEIGAGVGLMHVSSSGITADRMTISFPRIILKPLLLISKDPNHGFFQLYFRETRIFGEFTASDFNTKPGYTFASRVNGDVPKSFGFMIDGTLLFRTIKKDVFKK